MKLQNKSSIVTGGAQGIGKAISLAFAREGANVIGERGHILNINYSECTVDKQDAILCGSFGRKMNVGHNI